MTKFLLISIAINLFLIPTLPGQLSGVNMMEYQYGKVPDLPGNNLSTLYNDLDLQFRQKNVRIGVRFESFLNKYNEREYLNFTQYYLKYKNKGFDIRVGNFYDIIGNGILFRTYEINGAVLEDPAYRIRHGFYRDMEGVLVKYSTRLFMVKVIKGSPLVNQLPPTLNREERRIDKLDAIEGNINIFNQNIGGAFLFNSTQQNTERFYTIYASGNLPLNFSYRTELAQQSGHEIPILSNHADPHYAFYFSLNYSIQHFGVSFEFKDYQNFSLGTGFNDPPALVKEQPYKVLNRSTHIPLLLDESGFQLEVFYSFASGSLLTLNITRLNNELNPNISYLFSEYFIELNAPLGKTNTTKFFADYAQDPFKGEKNRHAAGISTEQKISNLWSTLIEIEAQHFHREIIQTDKINNLIFGITLSKSPMFSGGILWEISTDPNITDDSETVNIETKPAHFLGFNFNYKPFPDHTISLFAGSRRGGPACNSGICYEVPDFRGVEIRLISML